MCHTALDQLSRPPCRPGAATPSAPRASPRCRPGTSRAPLPERRRPEENVIDHQPLAILAEQHHRPGCRERWGGDDDNEESAAVPGPAPPPPPVRPVRGARRALPALPHADRETCRGCPFRQVIWAARPSAPASRAPAPAPASDLDRALVDVPLAGAHPVVRQMDSSYSSASPISRWNACSRPCTRRRWSGAGHRRRAAAGGGRS